MTPHPTPAGIAWRWPAGDLVFIDDQVYPLDDFRRRFPDIPLCEFADLEAIGELLSKV